MHNNSRGFILPILIVIIALLLAGGAYIYTQKDQYSAIQDSKIASTTQAVDFQTAEWNTYTNVQYGFSLQHPSYLGDIIVSTSSPKDCPTMKTYSRQGEVKAQDILISFSINPLVGNGKSFMAFLIPVVQTTKNTAEVCGLNLQELRKVLATDERYTSSVFSQKNSIETYRSTIATVIGTSASEFYTLFRSSGDSTIMIQPKAYFVPSAETAEEADIRQREQSGDQEAIVTFIKDSDKAKQIRRYFADLEQIVQSVSFI